MKALMQAMRRDPLVAAAAIYILAIVLTALIGPLFFDPVAANRSNLRMRQLAPFDLDNGWLYVLGTDSLGRSMLVRLIVSARTTLTIAASTVCLSLVVGTAIGVLTSLRDNFISAAVMRLVDVVMSIPSLLVAMVVLYALGAHILNVVLVLALTRIPVFARAARAQGIEVRERGFVRAATVMGASDWHIIIRHITPIVLPTVLSICALEFAVVMLEESTLTFLGIGVQPPDASWGLIVSEGRDYLQRAWWIALWPGLLIALLAISTTILGNWFRVANNPALRDRLILGAPNV